MNEKFLELPEEKRLRIINAGFEVFAESEYKHASTDLIAAKAGISKGLLFYYFHNKKALYLYLFDYAAETLREKVVDEHFKGITDFFELIEYSAERKVQVLERTPYIYDFVMRAFFSKGEDISEDVNAKTQEYSGGIYTTYLTGLDYSKLKPDIDPMEIYGMLTWLADGYIHQHQLARQPINVGDIMEKFRGWVSMFRKLSYKEEYQL